MRQINWLLPVILCCVAFCEGIITYPDSLDGQKQCIIKYDQRSFRISISNEDGKREIKCYDPDDPQFSEHNVPFLMMNIRDGKAEIEELGKTLNFAGKDIISIARSLQKEFHAHTMFLVDRSLSLPCPLDGRWCCDESLMDLRMTGVFLNGKGFYETHGALPKDKEYLVFAQFIHQMDVDALTKELYDLGVYYPEAQQSAKLLDKIRNRLALSTKDTTIGELSKSLYNSSKQNPTDHELWHRFHDRIIAEENSFHTLFILEHLTSLDEHIINTLLHYARKEINAHLKQNQSLTTDLNFADAALESFLTMMNRLKDSPVMFTLSSNTSYDCLKRTFHVSLPFPNHEALPKLYALASEMSIQSEDLISLFKKPLTRPGDLWARWILAKDKIRKTKSFYYGADECPNP